MIDLMPGFGAFTPAASGGGTPLLDTGIASAANAYSMRKLREAYAGSAIRIRRSSDDTEQDIGFSGENLDTAAIASFVGANNAFVVTWYDQAGSDNITVGTNSLQPRIVSAGTLDTKNSKPCALWDATDDYLRKTGVTTLAGVSQFTTAAVASLTSTDATAYRRIVSFKGSADGNDYTNATSAIALARNDTGEGVSSYRQFANRSSRAITYAQLFTALSIYDASNNTVSTDGTAGSASSYTAAALDATSIVLTVGAADDGSAVWNGHIGEVVIWASALSGGDQATVQTNQETYWGTP